MILSTSENKMTQKSGLMLGAIASALLLSAMLGQPAQAQPEKINLNPGFSPDPMELKGTVVGSAALRDIAGRGETSTGSCLGFGGGEPNHILRLTSSINYLRLQVKSNADTTLVIKGPGGTWCNDDFDDKNAGIAGQWQTGEYRVWIGLQGRGQTVPYQIRLTQQR
jgi:hypothetical protein